MSYTRTYTIHVVLGVLNTAVSGVLFYGLRIVLYNRLGAAEYAAFYGAMAFAMLAHPIVSLGFDPGLSPFVTRLREEGRFGALRGLLLRVGAIELAAGTVACLFLLAAAAPLSDLLFTDGSATSAFRVLGLYLAVLLFYKLVITLLLGLQHVGSRTTAEVSRAVCIFAITWLLIPVPGRASDVAWAYTAATACGAVVGLGALLVLRPALVRRTGAMEPGLTRRVFQEGKYTSIAFGGIMLFSQMDTVMLGIMRDHNAVAIASYQVAVPTFMILYSFILAVGTNFLPMVTALTARAEVERLGDGIRDLLRIAACVVLPLSAAMAAFAPTVISTLFHRDAPGAAVSLALLAAGTYWSFTGYFAISTLIGAGRSPAAAAMVAVGLVANLLLNVFLIAFLNQIGAALATTLSQGVLAYSALWAVRRTIPVGPVWRSELGAAIVSLCAFGAFAVIHGTTGYTGYALLYGMVASVLGVGVCVVTLFVLGLCPLGPLWRAWRPKSV